MTTLFLMALLLARCPGSAQVVSARMNDGNWVVLTGGAEIIIRPRFARVFIAGVEITNTVAIAWYDPISTGGVQPSLGSAVAQDTNEHRVSDDTRPPVESPANHRKTTSAVQGRQ